MWFENKFEFYSTFCWRFKQHPPEMNNFAVCRFNVGFVARKSFLFPPPRLVDWTFSPLRLNVILCQCVWLHEHVALVGRSTPSP